MTCRSACPTQDHASWGACARAANVQTMWLGGTGPSLGDVRRWHANNARYRESLVHGVTPEGYSDKAIGAAFDKLSKGA